MSVGLFLFKKRFSIIYPVDGNVHTHRFIPSFGEGEQIAAVSTTDFKYGDGIIHIEEILDIRNKISLTGKGKFTEILKSVSMSLLHYIGLESSYRWLTSPNTA